jgi:UDP-GlcNAc:undecaprenyl-phosphate/decaprenyl-phosphate GlcNAc-1-phosphate transferase
VDNSRKPPRPAVPRAQPGGGVRARGPGTAAGTAPVVAPVVAAAVAALAARGAYAGLRRRPPSGEKTWTRNNHRGELVTLLEGPAVALGAICGLAAARAVTGAAPCVPRDGRQGLAHRDTERVRAGAIPVTVATLGALGFGVLDDLRGSGNRRGLRGHLGALAHGEVTTGAVKLAGLAVTGLGAALLGDGAPADVAINAGLIAGGANLLNLFDLRPGRAIKVATGSAVLIALTGAAAGGSSARGIAAVAAPAGAALALLPEDLAERAMLGDAGANALGAALGASAARTLPRPARAGLLAVIVAFTLTSEKVSFTRVIERTPPLRWLDMLGRRPAPRSVPLTEGPLTDGPLTDGPLTEGPRTGGLLTGGPLAGAPRHAAPANAVPVTAEPAPRRRPPGRHRRAASGDSRSRSGGWLSALLKPPARQEP